MFIASALSNMGLEIRHLTVKKCNHFASLCASALSCYMWKFNYLHRHVNAIALHFFVAAIVKLPEFVINEPDFSPPEQGSNW